MSRREEVLCFTDLLCGYCYIGDARFEQLKKDFGDRIRLSYHFVSVFGDVATRIQKSGKSPQDYAAMIGRAAAPYDHVEVHPEVFAKNTPTSCVPSHLYLRAVKILEDAGRVEADDGVSPFERLMWELRVAFFRDARDISSRKVLDELARELGIDPTGVGEVIDSGEAFAALDRDVKLQREHGITVTPTLLFNEGRQRLNGNVGYRVIEANISELLSDRPAAMSWC